MRQNLYKRYLAGVLAFSLFAGIVSGFFTATSFMPLYAIHHNRRQWSPGSKELTVIGDIPGISGSRVIHAAAETELSKMGMPGDRLWLYDPQTVEQPHYALIAHGIWRQNPLKLGESVTVTIGGNEVSVPVAGVWRPFHPQLGDNWLVVVGESVHALAGADTEFFGPAETHSLLPAAFQGRNLLSWLLFSSLVFLLFGAIGYLGKEKELALAWTKKLWCGGAVAVIAGFCSAIFIFRASLPLPLFDLLPMTLALVAASYLLALLLLTCLHLALARWG